VHFNGNFQAVNSNRTRSEECLVRECKEELSVDIEIVEIYQLCKDIIKNPL